GHPEGVAQLGEGQAVGGGEHGNNGQPAAFVQQGVELVDQALEGSVHRGNQVPGTVQATSRCSRSACWRRSATSNAEPRPTWPRPKPSPIIGTAHSGPSQSVTPPRARTATPSQRIDDGA